jgi:cystathionine beta-lyase
MSSKSVFDRRQFLKVAGASAAMSAIPAHAATAAVAADGSFDFDEVVDRTGTDSIKWDRVIARYGEENVQVAMGIADMDFRVAPAISNAIQKRVNHDVWGYGSSAASYKEAVVEWNKRHHGEELVVEKTVVSAGVHEGLISAVRAFGPNGGKVILLTPTYSTFFLDVRKGGCQPVACPLKPVGGRFELDLEAVERTIDEQTRALILCNPSNPTGNCWSAEEMMALGEICLRRGVVVLSDEVHADITREGVVYTPFSMLDNEDIVRNSLSFKSESKCFNLAGHKIAYLYSSNAEYIDKIMATGHNHWLNTLGFVASEAALHDGEEWLNQVRHYIDGNLKLVDDFVRSKMPLVNFEKPQGTFLAWLDFGEFFEDIQAEALLAVENRKLDASSSPRSVEEYMQDYFIEHAGVHLNEGLQYGPGSAGYMRMNVATSRKRVRLALDNLARMTNAA